MTRVTKVPSIPDPTPDGLVDVARSVKNLLDVREGRAGDKQDRFVTFRDLEKMKVITDAKSNAEDPGSTNPGGPGPGGGGYNPGEDFTVPPIPTGFRVTGGYGVIMLDWDTPQSLYKNHAYTEIWRNTVDVIGNAVLVGTTIAAVYSDPVPANTTYYYWIRFVSEANVTGPYNSTSGTQATSAIDVPGVLKALTGQITESQLYGDLRSRIDLIDGDENLPGSWTYRWNQVTADTEAQFKYYERLYADQFSAVARQTTTLSTTVGNNTTSIQVNAASIDGILGKYTVKIDNNGSVSGYGLISEANNGTVVSQFYINANRFAITAPADYTGTSFPVGLGAGDAGKIFYHTGTKVHYRWTGSVWETFQDATVLTPFVVQATPTTVNGVAVPAGVYIRDAYIQNGTIASAKIGDAAITTAKIANLAVDSTKIANATITMAQIADTIQSTNWNPFFDLGWQINKAGTATFNNVTVRGTVYASAGSFTGAVTATSGSFTGSITAGSGTIGGIQINAGSISSTNYSNGPSTYSGFAINSDGSARFNNVDIRGTMTGVTGTFSGTLTADAIDAVNTINVAGNAVTVPVAATQSSTVEITSYGTDASDSTFYDIVSITANLGNSVTNAKCLVGFTMSHGVASGGNWVIQWKVIRTSDSAVIGEGFQYVPNNQVGGATLSATVFDSDAGSGNRTYKLQIANYGDILTARDVSGTVIYAIGVKR
jgi:hypothetical protein